MKRPTLLFVFVSAVLATNVFAADPQWWTTRGVKTLAASSNLSPATIGQVKHMVATGLAELETCLSAPELSALKADVASIVDLAVPPSPSNAFYQQQRAVLVVGQLKALGEPFYRHLYNVNPMWVEAQLRENQTNSSISPTNFFPWTTTTADDVNKAAATVGQLKAVFALRFSDDADGNQLADFWEYRYFGGTGNSSSEDPDGDGLTNQQESDRGTNPFLADSDGDQVNDGSDLYPLDPSRWASSGNNDVTAPQVILTSPENAQPL